MTHSITLTLIDWLVIVGILGSVFGLLVQKLTKEQPVITVDSVAGFRLGLARFMIVTDGKNFHFDSRIAMENFTVGCLMPYEMWEQDEKLTWHYLGGNRHA